VTVFVLDDESSHSEMDLAILQALLKGITLNTSIFLTVADTRDGLKMICTCLDLSAL